MLTIQGARVLLEDGTLDDVPVGLVEDGTIRLGRLGHADGRVFDGTGLFALPGIVDLHGDAFERQMQPRPGVDFPTALALRDTEAQLLANGITTAMLAATLSWEPGLRSVASWRRLVDTLDAYRPAMRCDMRMHMRWEMHNVPALEMAVADVESGRVGLVSFSDHTPSIVRKAADPAQASKFADRAGIEQGAFRALAEAAAGHAPHVPAATARLAAAAAAKGIPMASHDDPTVGIREEFRALGARICEFPMAEDVGLDARAAGDAVIMGCPNVVRGGSHLGWTSAKALAERDICTVLCSDYFYPAMLPAAWTLAQGGVLSLPQAWALVSTNPAVAAGLTDRGTIADGKRADIILVDPAGPTVIATFTAGHPAYLGAAAWTRLRDDAPQGAA